MDAMAAVRTRQAETSDAGAAIAVVRASITELCVADHENDPAKLERWLQNKTDAHFCGWLADPDNFLVVAELDGALCGVGSLHRSGEIRLFYVQPGRQGLGVGRALLGALEQRARGWHLSELTLNSSALARPFYEHHGFTSTGEPTCGMGVVRCFPYRKPLAAR
jgi:GNAT superfamily N-acetyltransferase